MENIFLSIEKDYEDNLEFIPWVVRYKLDKLGVKISLSQWQSLSLNKRKEIFSSPFKTNSNKKELLQTLEGIWGTLEGNKLGGNKSELADITLNEFLALDMESEAQLFSFSEPFKSQLVKKNITLKAQQWEALKPLEKYMLKKWAYSHKFTKLKKYLTEIN